MATKRTAKDRENGVKCQKRDGASHSFCCVPLCSMTGKYNSAVSYHTFPKDESQRKKWIHNIKRANLVINRWTTVCSRHFLSTDIIHGGNRRLVPGAVPVLFDWNDYTLPPVRPSVWERRPRPVQQDDPEEEEVDTHLPIQCHDYDQRPEPFALDMASEKMQAMQQTIEELQKRLAEVSLEQTFGIKRLCASDDDIRFFTR